MKRIILYSIFIILPLLVGAQTRPITNQYLVNPYALSPTLAGWNGFSEIFLGYRSEWGTVEGAPRTTWFSGSFALTENTWLGGSISGDKTDLFNRLYASLSYTYKLRIGRNQMLNFGLWGSMLHNSIDLQNVVVSSAGDPLLFGKSKLVGTAFNAGFGLSYEYKDFHVGFYVPELFVSKDAYVEGSDNNILVQERQFVFHTSLPVVLSPKWVMYPTLVYRTTTNAPSTTDIAALFTYINRFWAAGTFRTKNIIGISLGGKLLENLIFNYTFEFPTSAYIAKPPTAHEIAIGIRLNPNRKISYEKKKRNIGLPTSVEYKHNY